MLKHSSTQLAKSHLCEAFQPSLDLSKPISAQLKHSSTQVRLSSCYARAQFYTGTPQFYTGTCMRSSLHDRTVYQLMLRPLAQQLLRSSIVVTQLLCLAVAMYCITFILLCIGCRGLGSYIRLRSMLFLFYLKNSTRL